MSPKEYRNQLTKEARAEAKIALTMPYEEEEGKGSTGNSEKQVGNIHRFFLYFWLLAVEFYGCVLLFINELEMIVGN